MGGWECRAGAEFPPERAGKTYFLSWKDLRWRQLGSALIVGMLAACTTTPLPRDPATGGPTASAQRPGQISTWPPGSVAVPSPQNRNDNLSALPPDLRPDLRSDVRPDLPASPAVRDPGAAPAPIVTAATSAAWQWADAQPLPRPITQGKSVWTPVRWSELPGWGEDALSEAWNAWLRSCERPAPGIGSVCQEVRRLSIASPAEQHDWLMRRMQPYSVRTPAGESQGLLTGYYEPSLVGSRVAQGPYQTPLYRTPAGLRAGQPWFTRQQIDTDPAAQAAVRGQEIAWLADPIDALLLQIQGSGRLMVQEPDGSQRMVRLAFAAHNGHGYRSVARYLLDQGLIREGTWEAIREWAARNPERINEMLWSNPRTVFFREEPLTEFDARFGPRGAQGVALTPERSIAVDRESIPYGTPVWLRTVGPVAQLQRLVLAQDTGGAIIGAVRADYFTGWGDGAYTLAAGLKQPLQMWVLWPRSPS